MIFLRRVDISHGATRVTMLLCPVRKDGPRSGIQLCCLREIKAVVLFTINYDRICLEHLTSACGGSLNYNKSRI